MLIAFVLAGGTGSRMGADRPKQFLALDGRMVIEHTIEAFDRAACVDEVAVVVHPDWLEFMSEVVGHNHWAKVTRLIPGGDERYMSSVNALNAYADAPEDTNVLFHDAARPWVSQEVIARVGEALMSAQAVGVGIPSTDTVWQIDPASNTIATIPDRSTMYRAQTPQAFRLSVIAEAYCRALQDPSFKATDDCGVLLRYAPEIPIHIVAGEEQNKKITYPQDLI
jgi:2-C-methyl-D-erythritol 4-phosphate cytidylyltransferase